MVEQVQAASGPSEDYDPMVVTSDGSGASGAALSGSLSLDGGDDGSSNEAGTAPSTGGNDGSNSCKDITPPGQYSCQQQKVRSAVHSCMWWVSNFVAMSCFLV